jgi:hypothetical protein
MRYLTPFIERMKALVANPTSLIASAVARIKAAIKAHPDKAAWVFAGLGLLLIVTIYNPVKFMSFIWIATKIIGAALLGVALFKTWDTDPEKLDGIERAMAYTRCATLMAAAIIASAFTP